MKSLHDATLQDSIYYRPSAGGRPKVSRITKITPTMIVCEEGARFAKLTGLMTGTRVTVGTIATPEQIAANLRFKRVLEAQTKLSQVRVTEANLIDTEHYLETLERLKYG